MNTIGKKNLRKVKNMKRNILKNVVDERIANLIRDNAKKDEVIVISMSMNFVFVVVLVLFVADKIWGLF